MPTKPLESILHRSLSKAEAKDVVEIASPLLQEVINYSTNALVRCATSSSGRVDEDLAVLALYRHIIEMTDAIEVLISQSCAIPAIPLLRSSFEALLSVEYILEENEHYARRSLSWLVGYVHERLDMYNRLDSSTTKGDKFRAFLTQDEALSNVPLPASTEAQQAKASLLSLLAKPHVQPIETEFNRHKGKPKWYQLFNGPRNLQALAEHLNQGARYEMLYRYWSRLAHAQDALEFIATGRLRDPSQLAGTATFASTFLLRATRLLLRRLRPGEDLAPWYKSEVRPCLSLLTPRS